MVRMTCRVALLVSVAVLLLAASAASATRLGARVFGEDVARCGQQNGGALCQQGTEKDAAGRVLPVCCSKMGFCGNDPAYHCSEDNCQSQCAKLPKVRALTKAVPVVPLPGVVNVEVVDTACPTCAKPAPAPTIVTVVQRVPVAVSKAQQVKTAQKAVVTPTRSFQALQVVEDVDEDGRSLLLDDSKKTFKLLSSRIIRDKVLDDLQGV